MQTIAKSFSGDFAWSPNGTDIVGTVKTTEVFSVGPGKYTFKLSIAARSGPDIIAGGSSLTSKMIVDVIPQ